VPEEPPRRGRMSRHIRLVLLGGVPGLLGCGGCCGCVDTATAPMTQPAEDMEEVEEFTEDPPPDGPGHMVGAAFIGWWIATHPPIVAYRRVPRSIVTRGGYTRTSSGLYHHTYFGGRSNYLNGGSSSARPSGSAGIVRGGFGSTGHVAAAGA
jgi:hypothetical protein